MEYKQNLHIHSTYCDGADTPEETIRTAIEKGFDSIGFSGHSYMYYSNGRSMSLEDTEAYKREIAVLKEKYRDRISVFCGLEYDMYSNLELSGYDYVIGSLHYMPIGGKLIGFDRSQEEVQRIITTYFGGNGMRYAKRYYELLATLPEHGRFDILGHADLLTKHRESVCFFDEGSKEYQRYAAEALEALAGKIPFFEVNTGAVARGYCTTPYPSPFLIKEMKRLGFGAMISSDCHDRRFLDQGYAQAEELLKQCGYREIYVLKETGFEPVAIG